MEYGHHAVGAGRAGAGPDAKCSYIFYRRDTRPEASMIVEPLRLAATRTEPNRTVTEQDRTEQSRSKQKNQKKQHATKKTTQQEGKQTPNTNR